MTKEKALIILNECRLGGFARTLYTKEEYCTARDMAIRALEEHETVTEFADRCRECGREKVLDKIVAEINDLIESHDVPIEIDGGDDAWFCEGCNRAIEIIDKYRELQESEG